jgi:beta-lactamase class A
MTLAPSSLARLATDAGLEGAVLHLVPLAGGQAVVVDDDRFIYPASTMKVPLALAVAVAVRDGRLAWNDHVIVEAANMTVNDAASPLEIGYTAEVGQLVDLMISRSDNVATNILIDVAGRERASADLADLGFAGTVIRRKLSGSLPLIDDPEATGRNTHPARDAAALFVRLAAGDLPGSDRINAALAAQVWNTKLSAGLADGDRFAHKTGDTDEVSHDGGILTLASGERYVLVVYTELPTSDAVDARFAAFMRALRPRLIA